MGSMLQTKISGIKMDSMNNSFNQTDATPLNRFRGGRNGNMNSIFNDSETEIIDQAPSKFKTKFVDQKSRKMQISRYEKMVAK